MSTQRLTCPSCGEPADRLNQGYCEACLQHRHDAHLLEIARAERWNRMSPAERDREIRDAGKRA